MKIYILLFSLFFTSCSHSSDVLIHIPEASGICYSKNSDSLFVANDEGKVYEISREGKLLRKKRLGKYDLEGVTCDDKNNKLIFAVEGKDHLLVVNQKNLTIQKEVDIKRYYHGINLLKRDKKNHGLEGITLLNDTLLLSNQSKKKWPKSNPSVVIKVDYPTTKKKIVIKDIIKHGYKDISGLCYHNGFLYMVTDTQNLLIKYDIKNDKTISSKTVPDGAIEGVAFDNDGYIYFANDEGTIIKTKAKGFL